MLPTEPHGTEEDDAAAVAAATAVVAGGGGASDLRTGRWHSYETQYAQHVVEDFNAGTLPIAEGTKLASLLCRLVRVYSRLLLLLPHTLLSHCVVHALFRLVA